MPSASVVWPFSIPHAKKMKYCLAGEGIIESLWLEKTFKIIESNH